MQTFFKLQPYFLALYLLAIGIAIGAGLASGAFTAPTLFRAAMIVPNLTLTTLESGLLMTAVFLKLNGLLNMLAFFILAYEILSLRMRHAKIAPLLGLISVVLIGLFTLYYTPKILQAQQLGEDGITTVAFNALHTQSVLVFKALIVTLCLLFIIRFLSVCGDYRGK